MAKDQKAIAVLQKPMIKLFMKKAAFSRIA